MPEDWVVFIPTDHRFVPPIDAQDAARSLVERRLPDAPELAIDVSDHPELVHGFVNFENAFCPFCGDILVGPDFSEWFDEALTVAWRSNFEDLVVELPCCARSASLNELHYSFPMGFARFQLRARDPNVGPRLPPGLLRDLESVLGCRLRIVRQHL